MKAAYEMRISDWIADVCSSDLRLQRRLHLVARRQLAQPGIRRLGDRHAQGHAVLFEADDDEPQLETLDLLLLDANDLAHAMRRVDDPVAGLVMDFFAHFCLVSLSPVTGPDGILHIRRTAVILPGTVIDWSLLPGVPGRTEMNTAASYTTASHNALGSGTKHQTGGKNGRST